MLERGRRDLPLSILKQVASALVIPLKIFFSLGAENDQLDTLHRELAGQLALTALEP